MIPVTTVELFVRLFDHLSVMACADPTPEYWQYLALQLKLLRCSFRTEVQGC